MSFISFLDCKMFKIYNVLLILKCFKIPGVLSDAHLLLHKFLYCFSTKRFTLVYLE